MLVLLEVDLLRRLADVFEEMRCGSLCLPPAPPGAAVAVDAYLCIGMPTFVLVHPR
jgi:hypothetical protein